MAHVTGNVRRVEKSREINTMEGKLWGKGSK
jgi:hypothetical protein